MTAERIARINELAKKSRETGLTDAEKAEQAELRAEYIKGYTQNLRAQLDNTYIVDEQVNKQKLKNKKI